MGERDQQNKNLIRQFVEVSYRRDLAGVDKLMSGRLVRHSQATSGLPVTSPADFKQFQQSDWASVLDSVVVLRHIVAEGDLVAVFATYSGTQTGQRGPLPP